MENQCVWYISHFVACSRKFTAQSCFSVAYQPIFNSSVGVKSANIKQHFFKYSEITSVERFRVFNDERLSTVIKIPKPLLTICPFWRRCDPTYMYWAAHCRNLRLAVAESDTGQPMRYGFRVIIRIS